MLTCLGLNIILSDKRLFLNMSKYWRLISNICHSVTQSCLTLCDPMGCIMPGYPVLYYLPEFAYTHVYWVNDAIQPSHPLSPTSPPALNLSNIGICIIKIYKALEICFMTMWIFSTLLIAGTFTMAKTVYVVCLSSQFWKKVPFSTNGSTHLILANYIRLVLLLFPFSRGKTKTLVK